MIRSNHVEGEELYRQAIKILRERQNLTQKDLAARAHVNPSTINQIEAGRQNPSLRTIVGIASALKTTVERLQAGNSEPLARCGVSGAVSGGLSVAGGDPGGIENICTYDHITQTLYVHAQPGQEVRLRIIFQ
jgi:transcriptional regulator with XRE-family HTH domain